MESRRAFLRQMTASPMLLAGIRTESPSVLAGGLTVDFAAVGLGSKLPVQFYGKPVEQAEIRNVQLQGETALSSVSLPGSNDFDLALKFDNEWQAYQRSTGAQFTDIVVLSCSTKPVRFCLHMPIRFLNVPDYLLNYRIPVSHCASCSETWPHVKYENTAPSFFSPEYWHIDPPAGSRVYCPHCWSAARLSVLTHQNSECNFTLTLKDGLLQQITARLVSSETNKLTLWQCIQK